MSSTRMTPLESVFPWHLIHTPVGSSKSKRVIFPLGYRNSSSSFAPTANVISSCLLLTATCMSKPKQSSSSRISHIMHSSFQLVEDLIRKERVNKVLEGRTTYWIFNNIPRHALRNCKSFGFCPLSFCTGPTLILGNAHQLGLAVPVPWQRLGPWATQEQNWKQVCTSISFARCWFSSSITVMFYAASSTCNKTKSKNENNLSNKRIYNWTTVVFLHVGNQHVFLWCLRSA